MWKKALPLLIFFCSKYNLSDECSGALNSLIRGLLPEGNKFPSGYSHLKGVKSRFAEGVRVLDKTPDKTFCVLKFCYQIKHIVQRNLNEIGRFSEYGRDYLFTDFTQSICPGV